MYVEPMSLWLWMPTDMERTRPRAMALLEEKAAAGGVECRAAATSAVADANGEWDGGPTDLPWCKGYFFSMSPQPSLAAAGGSRTQPGRLLERIQPQGERLLHTLQPQRPEAGQALGPQKLGGVEQAVLVDQPRPHESPGENRPALNQQAHHVAPPEFDQQSRQVQAPVGAHCQRDDLGARRGKPRQALRRGPLADRDRSLSGRPCPAW